MKLLLLNLIFLSGSAAAVELNADGILNSLIDEFVSCVNDSAGPIHQAAMRLFWLLVPINLVISGIRCVFNGDFSDFFFSLVTSVLFTGIFYYLLSHDYAIGKSIIDSFVTMVDDDYMGPSELIDLVFNIDRQINNLMTSNVLGLVSKLQIVICMIVFSVVMFFVILRFVSIYLTAQILCVIGVFVLGFGGLKATRYLAVNYLKLLISKGLELITVLIITKTGCRILNDVIDATKLYEEGLSVLKHSECMVMIFISLFIYVLSKSLPPVMSSLMSGTSGGFETGSGLSLKKYRFLISRNSGK
ncbi:type IV secretion system protein [Succinivibrio dextrinosolvens]|uniref:type IV secretion system protein n=1 Tax=Succinivibrio dextrinosolvens TaxID=83771 RepID=UPI0024792CB9|nr:type IV secretion system protein [Succinivibrio dextrinosolvens]